MARSFHKVTPAGRPGGVRDEMAVAPRRRRETQAVLVKGDRGAARRNDLVPDLRIEMIEVASLRPAARQMRRRDAVQASKLKASLERYGVVKPILINGACDVIEGHGILEAAKALGIEQIPSIVIDHLNAEEQRMLRLALNRLSETGSWDFEELRLEFEDLIALGCDVINSGFELAEVNALLFEDEDTEEAAEVMPAGPVVSRPGDVWLLGRHRLLQGDARAPSAYEELMLPGEAARLVLTDVPYHVPIAAHVTSDAAHRELQKAAGEMSPKDFAALLEAALGTVLPHVIDGGLLASFIDWRSVDLLIGCGRELGLGFLNLVVWAKMNAGKGSLWRSQHELLPVFKKGTAAHVNNVELGRCGRWRSNLWIYADASLLGSETRGGLSVHPRVKPRAMLTDALLDVSHRDDIVIDPFVGSGSTLLAAEATGRVCRAIEIDAECCGVVIRRWQAMTGKTAVLERSGERFDDLAVADAEASQ